MVYVREAGRLADKADAAALALIRAGADEGAILAAQHAAIFGAGGDYPANEFIIGSGRRRPPVPLQGGPAHARRAGPDHARIRRRLRHYHAAIMRTVMVGEPTASTAPTTKRPARRCSPARRSCARAGPRATCSRPMRGCSTRTACRSIGSTPAAIRSARSSRPPGWTGRCSTRQPMADRARHGVLRPYDPDGFADRDRHVPRADLDRDRDRRASRSSSAIWTWRSGERTRLTNRSHERLGRTMTSMTLALRLRCGALAALAACQSGGLAPTARRKRVRHGRASTATAGP